jgi:lipid-binding SYLF domain-containing protein
MKGIASLLCLILFVGCGSEESAKVSGAPGEGDSGSATAAGDVDAGHAAAVDAIGGEDGAAIRAFLAKDSSMKKFFHGAHGFAIWPSVGKGGLVIGGGGGSGSVYERGKLIGTTKLSFVSVGAQIGGQSFAEVIFFKDKAAIDNFKRGNFEFGAQVSAVAATAGAANGTDYDSGVAVFTLPKKGLMAEASVSGQEFTFEPK